MSLPTLTTTRSRTFHTTRHLSSSDEGTGTATATTASDNDSDSYSAVGSNNKVVVRGSTISFVPSSNGHSGVMAIKLREEDMIISVDKDEEVDVVAAVEMAKKAKAGAQGKCLSITLCIYYLSIYVSIYVYIYLWDAFCVFCGMES